MLEGGETTDLQVKLRAADDVLNAHGVAVPGPTGSVFRDRGSLSTESHVPRALRGRPISSNNPVSLQTRIAGTCLSFSQS